MNVTEGIGFARAEPFAGRYIQGIRAIDDEVSPSEYLSSEWLISPAPWPSVFEHEFDAEVRKARSFIDAWNIDWLPQLNAEATKLATEYLFGDWPRPNRPVGTPPRLAIGRVIRDVVEGRRQAAIVVRSWSTIDELMYLVDGESTNIRSLSQLLHGRDISLSIVNALEVLVPDDGNRVPVDRLDSTDLLAECANRIAYAARLAPNPVVARQYRQQGRMLRGQRTRLRRLWRALQGTSAALALVPNRTRWRSVEMAAAPWAELEQLIPSDVWTGCDGFH